MTRARISSQGHTNPVRDTTPAWSPDGQVAHLRHPARPQAVRLRHQHIAVSPPLRRGKVLTLAFDRMSITRAFRLTANPFYFHCRTTTAPKTSAESPLLAARSPAPLAAVSWSTTTRSRQPVNLGRPRSPPFDRPTSSSLSPPLPRWKTYANHPHQRRFHEPAQAYPRRVRPFQKQGRHDHLRFPLQPLDYVPGKKYPTSFARTAVPSGLTMPSSPISAQLYAPMLRRPFSNPRGSAGSAKSTPKPSTLIGATRTFRMTWRWSITPSSRESPTRKSSGSAAGPYGGISTDFIIAQTNRFKAAISGAGSALFISSYATTNIRKTTKPSWAILGEQSAWEKISPFYRVTNITTPTLSWAANRFGTFPILGGEQMFQALKRLGRTTESSCIPANTTNSKRPLTSRTASSATSRGIAHYVKGDPCLRVRTCRTEIRKGGMMRSPLDYRHRVSHVALLPLCIRANQFHRRHRFRCARPESHRLLKSLLALTPPPASPSSFVNGQSPGKILALVSGAAWHPNTPPSSPSKKLINRS